MQIPLGEFLIKILVSLFFGALIGFEREVRKSPAGLRTVAFVCMGATLFTLASLEFGSAGGDISRIVGQIVVGIGFIGAGVIWQTKNKVHGLTSAASLWVMAAVGIMVGIGEYMIAAITTGLVLLLLLFGIYEKKALH
jgi:putative Mg2+ transporter-C (MgtC) family protein